MKAKAADTAVSDDPLSSQAADQWLLLLPTSAKTQLLQ